MFKKKKVIEYDVANLTPAIRVSICTGEEVAGFIDNKEKKFKEVMLIKNEFDLEEFKALYNITNEIKKIY